MTTSQATVIPVGYTDWLAEIKVLVTTARQRAVLAANAEQMRLYWQIGLDILDREASQGWGSKVIDRLAAEPLITSLPPVERLESELGDLLEEPQP